MLKKPLRKSVPCGLLWLMWLLLVPFVQADDAVLVAALNELNVRSFDAKYKAAERLAGLEDPRVTELLEALIEGQLYRQREAERVVLAERLDGGGYALTDPVSGESLGEVGRRGARKISVNNKLRRQLRALLAARRLNDADPDTRAEAVYAIVEGGDPELEPVLAERAAVEQHRKVKQALKLAQLVFDLDAADEDRVLAAIERSEAFLHVTVRTRLTGIEADSSRDPVLRKSARDALDALAQRASRYELLETLFFGLSLGSILVLAAIGLSITFGVMGVINMAHGELMMLGAYTTYVVQLLMPDAIEFSLFVALPAAFLISALVGIAIERGVVRFLYGRPLETLLATFGVSLILQQAVRSLFSPLNRSVSTPQWMSGSWEIVQGLSITYNRLYIFFFALAGICPAVGGAATHAPWA